MTVFPPSGSQEPGLDFLKFMTPALMMVLIVAWSAFVLVFLRASSRLKCSMVFSKSVTKASVERLQEMSIFELRLLVESTVLKDTIVDAVDDGVVVLPRCQLIVPGGSRICQYLVVLCQWRRVTQGHGDAEVHH